MSWQNWLQLGTLVGIVLLSTRPLGSYLARVIDGGATPRDRIFLPLERAIYRTIGVDPAREQPWSIYAASLLAFSAVSVVGLFLLQRMQGLLPLNPTDVDGVPSALAFNTAASFA
jgi:potassium-transporting ATPase potassium-binding subunit